MDNTVGTSRGGNGGSVVMSQNLNVGTPKLPSWSKKIKKGTILEYFWNEDYGWCRGQVIEDPLRIVPDEIVLTMHFPDDDSTHRLPFSADEKVRWRPPSSSTPPWVHMEYRYGPTLVNGIFWGFKVRALTHSFRICSGIFSRFSCTGNNLQLLLFIYVFTFSAAKLDWYILYCQNRNVYYHYAHCFTIISNSRKRICAVFEGNDLLRRR